jgi:GNAT superfamily N-acetyltransferase
MSENDISASDLRVSKITEKDLDVIDKFETDVKDLKDFLIDDALNNQKLAISTTYLVFYNPDNRLVGYISILADALRVHGTTIGKSFVDIGVNYKTLPALKIGRMCVDKNYSRRGIGTHMIYFAMKILLKMSEKIGCRFIFIDAKTQTDAPKFYKKFGFVVLKAREKGTIPMFLDMVKYIERYKEGKIKLMPSSLIGETTQ